MKNDRLRYAIIIFLIFFGVMLAEQSFVYPYMDDYGYASLSYMNVIPGVHGTDYTLPQFLEYFRLHYLNVTGRIFWDSLCALALKNIWIARIAQSAAITLLMATVTYIISKSSQKKPHIVAIIVCCLYGFMEIFLFEKGIYWFCASAIYVWPLIPILLVFFSFWQDITEGRRMSVKKTILFCVILFFTATAQEQVAVLQIAFLALLVLYKAIKTKKITLPDFLLIASSIGGFLFLILAPAASYRMAQTNADPTFAAFGALSIPQKIGTTTPVLFQYLFSNNFYLLTAALLVSGILAAYRALKHKKGLNVLNIFCIIVFILCLSLMVVRHKGLYQWALQAGIPVSLCGIASAVLILLVVYSFAAYYVINKRYFFFFAFIAAWVSVCSILAVLPPSQGRLYIPLAMLLILVMGDIIADSILQIRENILKIVCLSLMALIAACNMISYTNIYYNDSGKQIENNRILQAASQNIKNGQDIKEINLLYYPNVASDVWVPNEGNRQVAYSSYIETEIKAYYDIPQSVKITWVL